MQTSSHDVIVWFLWNFWLLVLVFFSAFPAREQQWVHENRTGRDLLNREKHSLAHRLVYRCIQLCVVYQLQHIIHTSRKLVPPVRGYERDAKNLRHRFQEEWPLLLENYLPSPWLGAYFHMIKFEFKIDSFMCPHSIVLLIIFFFCYKWNVSGNIEWEVNVKQILFVSEILSQKNTDRNFILDYVIWHFSSKI